MIFHPANIITILKNKQNHDHMDQWSNVRHYNTKKQMWVETNLQQASLAN